jgi:hypothetical protein
MSPMPVVGPWHDPTLAKGATHRICGACQESLGEVIGTTMEPAPHEPIDCIRHLAARIHSPESGE